MDVAVIVVERQRDLHFRRHLLEGRISIRTPAVGPGLAEDARLPGMRMRIVRIER